MGIAALALGIVALFTWIIPPLGLVVGIIGMILGIVALISKTQKKRAIAGLIMCFVGIILISWIIAGI